MKHLFLSIFLLSIAAGQSAAQWKDFEFNNPAVFGVYDTSLYASQANNGEHLYRYTPWGSDRWTISDAGLNTGYPPSVSAMGSLGPYFFAGCGPPTGGGIFRSSDSGQHWAAIDNGFKEFDVTAIVTMGPVLFASGGGVYRSFDSGGHWTNLNHAGTNMVLAVLGNVLFVASNAGVLRSTDSGNNWIPTNVSTTTDAIMAIGSVLLAGTDGAGIFRSTDGGIVWTKNDTGLFNPFVNSLVTDGKNIFAGTGSIGQGRSGGGSGVFLSTDSGLTWDTVNAGIPQTGPTGIDNYLNVLTLCVFDTMLIAGTWDDAGVYSKSFIRPISEMVKSKDAVPQVPPQSAMTISVYPNPLSNSAVIAYTLPESGAMSLVIYDPLGRTVAVPIADEHQSAVEYRVDFDASHLAPGMYWCRLTAGDRVQITKFIIER